MEFTGGPQTQEILNLNNPKTITVEKVTEARGKLLDTDEYAAEHQSVPRKLDYAGSPQSNPTFLKNKSRSDVNSLDDNDSLNLD